MDMTQQHRNNYFKLVALIVDVAYLIISKYIKEKILGPDSFESFLNKEKHKLVHIYETSQCCECTIPSINKEKLITRKQLLILYTSDKGNQIRDHKRYVRNKLTQICICEYSAKAHIDVRKVDITLASFIIQKCGKHAIGIYNWIEQIRDVKNEIFHLSDLQEITDYKLSRTWTKLEGSIMGIAKVIGSACAEETEKNIMQAKKLTIVGDYMLKYEIICRDYWKNKCAELERTQLQAIEEKAAVLLHSMPQRFSRSTEKDCQKTMKRISNKIPEQITKMDEESIDIYLKALETGSEQRRDINLVIVGKKGVGKTSLVRRLFGENIADVKSTNGIEIHRRRGQISLHNWKWHKIPDTTAMKESSINNRLLQAMVIRLNQGMVKKTKHTFETSPLDVLESDENEENTSVTATGQVTKQLHDRLFRTDEQLAISESITASHSSELALQMLSSIIRPDLDLKDEDSHATLTVWDFAGDKEFYNTHQTFMNPEAIYLVVANLADINDTESNGLLRTFNFWMNTIHCYGSISEKPSEVNGLLDPAVIAVGTHKDKFEDEEKCKELLASYTNEIFTDSKLHLRSTHIISNTAYQEDVFRELRNDIFATAKNGANWNREYPVKFIQIEKAINSELMNGKRIIPFERVKELSSNTSLPVSDDKELRVFLKYQHEVGNLLFFEDIPSYIILNPQWLADAFKCIVSAVQFQLELPHLDWSEMKQIGRMDSKLLDAIFRKQSGDIRNHKEHILEIVEKFDIIIRPSLLMDNGSIHKELCFFVPCMIQTSRVDDIDTVFKVQDDNKSTCLCFVFRFLPPYIISSLIVSCLREYSLASVGGQIGLFKDSCVFNISKNGCAKFLLAKCNHIIELQVWQWGEVNLVQNRNLLKFIETEINRIVNTRYQMTKVSVKNKWKCETTSYSFDREFHEFDEVHDGEMYYCKEHATVHRYKEYWSGEKSKVPCRISSERQNYVRMSMIVLDVLSCVLYDRLNIDTKTGETLDRDKLDITEMIKKYRALKINFPSKGYREIGKVDEMSTNEDNIGDDIQRIRVIRNEMLHTSTCALDYTRYQSLITIIQDMLTRFDQRNNPTGYSYVNIMDQIRKMELKARNPEEMRGCIKTGSI